MDDPRAGRASELRHFLNGDAACTRDVEAAIRGVVRSRHYRIGSDDQMDLVQSALVDLWVACSQDDFALRHSLKALARRIAMARCVDWVRRVRMVEALPEDMVDPRDDPLEELGKGRTLRRLASALASLRPLCRQLIRRHIYENERYSEIAEDLGRNESTLRVHMFKCVQQLRKLYGVADV